MPFGGKRFKRPWRDRLLVSYRLIKYPASSQSRERYAVPHFPATEGLVQRLPSIGDAEGLRARTRSLAQSRRCPVSSTTSPSSLTKGTSFGTASSSSTSSDGRQSFVPSSVTTIGRSI